jgi:hypothetical protein
MSELNYIFIVDGSVFLDEFVFSWEDQPVIVGVVEGVSGDLLPL